MSTTATLPPVAKRVLILGSTGSIGEQALDVVAGSEELELAGLAAGRNADRLVAQARETGARAVALSDPEAVAVARAELAGARVLAGDEGIRELIAAAEPDLVLNAIVGTAGLGPTIASLSAGIDLALAEQGEPRRRRRAGDDARRGDRGAHPPGRLRALGAGPADRGTPAGDGRAPRADRIRRAVPRSSPTSKG